MTEKISDKELLDAIFKPTSIAVIGASDKAGKMGFVVFNNIIKSYKGKVYPINPGEWEVQGYRAYPTVKDVPEPIDLAVIVVPAPFVPSVMKECAEKGVRAAVILSAGFKEAGPEGKKLEEEIVEIAKRAGIRVVGPNCFGIYNCNIGLNASIAIGTPERGGDISFATQSGAYGMAIYSSAVDRKMKFAKVISYGNKCDVDEVDCLRYFGADPETKVIAFFVESIDRGREFFEVAKEVSKRKPIVCTKTGRTPQGSRAAVSHTSAMTGSTEVYLAAYKQAGIIFANNGLELIDIVQALDWQPLPKGNRVGIMTNSGGTGVELADLCVENGLDVPELPAEVQARIKPKLLPFASSRNPVDFTPDWPRFKELYYTTMVEFFECETIDIIMPILLGRAARMPEVITAVRDATIECQQKRGINKPVIVCWVSSKEDELRYQKILLDARIPCYEWPARAARVAGMMWRYAKYLAEKA